MQLEANMILYHCNDKKRSLKFLSSDTYMIISEEDGKWLGQGMYFWDNLGNAQYWKAEKQKKSPAEEFIIIKACVSMEKVLDLTDTEICEMLAKVWDAWKDKVKITDCNEEVPLGKKLNIFYKQFPGFKDTYQVFKIYGKYNKTPRNSLFQYNLSSSTAEPTLAVKCIYNVKCRDAIKQRVPYTEVVYNG